MRKLGLHFFYWTVAFFLFTNSAFSAVGDSQFQQEVDQLTNTKRVHGNEIDILKDAVKDYLLRTQIIDEAKHFINIYTLCISKDKTGKATVAQLCEKAALEDVEVRLIYHPLSQMVYASPSLVLAMNSMEVHTQGYWAKNVNIFNLYRYLLIGCHKKALITDNNQYGMLAIVGGRNIGDDYLTNIPDAAPGEFKNRWRDTDIFIKGPAIYDIQKDFIDSFNRQCGANNDAFITFQEYNNYFPVTHTDNPSANSDIRVLHNEPDLNHGHGVFKINKMYKKLIDSAQYSIDIETPYFVPQPELLQALYDALERGVEVRILTNAAGNNDGGKPLYLGSAYYWEGLIKAGAKMYLWGPERSVMEPKVYRQLHSKYIIVDNSLFMPGSWNFDGRAHNHENEYSFSITDPEIVDAASLMYEEDLDTIGVYSIDLEWMKDNFSWWDKLQMKAYSKLSRFL